MAVGLRSLKSVGIVVALFCLAASGLGRDVLFAEEEDVFICPIEGQTGSRKQREPCFGQIGKPISEESTGSGLRKLLTHFSRYSPSSRYGGNSMFDRFFGSGGRSPYGGNSGSGQRYPYGGNSGSGQRYPYGGNSGSGQRYPYGGNSGSGQRYPYGGNSGSGQQYPYGGNSGSGQRYPNGGNSGSGGSGFPSGPSGGPSTPVPSGGGGGCSDTDSSVQAVIACTNAVRTNPGAFQYPCSSSWLGEYTRQSRGPLAINNELMRAAQAHSNDQSRRNDMSHTGGDGSSVGDRARRAGYSWRGIAENVAFGQRSAKQVVMSWMCSSGHRRNMMSCSYSDLGVGVDCSRGRCFYTQNFGCRGGCGCQGGGSSGGSGGGYNPSSGGFGPSSGGQRPRSSGGSPYDRYRSRYQPQDEQMRSRNPYGQTSQRYPFASDSSRSSGDTRYFSGSEMPGSGSPFSNFFNFG